MKIAFIVGSPPKKLGSLEQWMLGVVAEAQRRGHQIDLFTLQPAHPEVRAELQRLGAGFGSVEELEASPVASVRRLAGYDVLYANMVLPRSPAALSCYAAWPAKVVFVDHNSGYPPPAWKPLRRMLSRALDQVTLCRVDALVGVSEYVRRRDAERFGLAPERTRVIYNGVDPSRFSTEKTPAPHGELRLLCVGQLIPGKGIDVLLRALTKVEVKNFSLRVVGIGWMEPQLRALAAELGLAEHVEFLGMRDDVPLLFREADVFVHPAVFEEAFGLVVTEGMASGCGVIATRSGGIPEIIDDDEDGLLVPKGDEDALARAIDRMAFEPELRKRLAEAGRRKVEHAFTLSRWVAEHVDYMEQVYPPRFSGFTHYIASVWRTFRTSRPSA